MTAPSDRCPQCGASLPPDAIAFGQCPACLLRLAFTTDVTTVDGSALDTAGVPRTGGTSLLHFAPRERRQQ